MRRLIIAIAVTAIVALTAACGSGSDEDAVASLPTADISSFPTPSGSQATRPPEPEPTATVPAAQSDEAAEDDESVTANAPPMTPEELQELSERFQRGELSEEEAQEVFQRLREQFGGGQGGPGLGGLGPGGPGGSQAAGVVEGVDGSTITVATELSTVTANVGYDAVINITAVLETSALADDTQVMVISERVEGSNVARTVTILPEGQGGFGRGAGGFGGLGGGQGAPGGLELGAVRPLVGTVSGTDDGGFTLETQQGPLPISVDDETLIIETSQGTIGDLQAGMRITVIGETDENGTIEARIVSVAPEGVDLEGLRGFGGGGRNPGARGTDGR